MTDTEEHSSPNQATRSLTKWWKIFKANPSKTPGISSTSLDQRAGRVFGVAMQQSLAYASVAISQVGPDGKARIYGHIPIVVAKTGLYLKENGVTTQGVFRVSGSNKRIRELEQLFDSPPGYGKHLVWDSFSVHDAASVLRRYLNQLPEPVIPFELYQAFQEALPRSVDGATSITDHRETTGRYRTLIKSLPLAQQHIFFYILDLLGVFARKSDQNLMPASNLAMIFQPGILRHRPITTTQSAGGLGGTSSGADDSDAAKALIEADSKEHKRAQDVLEFLIANQMDFELELPPNFHKQPKKQKRKNTASSQYISKDAMSIASSAATKSPILPSLNASPSLKASPLLNASPALPQPLIAESAILQKPSATSAAEPASSALARRGSDKSEHRKQIRRKKADAAKLGADGPVTVKRSRTLPTSGSRPSRTSKEETTATTLTPVSSNNAQPSVSLQMTRSGSESGPEKEKHRWWKKSK